MRITVLVIAIISALAITPAAGAPHKAKVSSSSKPQSEPLPVFEFKGLTAGQPLPPGITGPCVESSYPPKTEKQCGFIDRDIAGAKPIFADQSDSFFYARTFDDKLSAISFTASSENYPMVVAALISKYGKPCLAEVEKWQNKAGATFDNPTATWCFATGKLVAKSMSFQRDYMELTYRDVVTHGAEEKPKLNF